MTRSRRITALACVALVVMAAVFPLGGAALEWCLYTPEFILLPPTELASRLEIRPAAIEQLHPLLASAGERGPPLDSSTR